MLNFGDTGGGEFEFDALSLASRRLTPLRQFRELSWALFVFAFVQVLNNSIPRYVATCNEFPMTVTGKIQKFKLREQAIEQLGLAASEGIETG